MLTSLRSVIKNPKNVNRVLPLLYDTRNQIDAWNGNAPEALVKEMRLSKPRMNHIHPHIISFFEPYFDNFPEQYRRVDQVIEQLPNIIDRIKAMKEVPPAPPLQQPVRYVDTVEYAVNQILKFIDEPKENSKDRVLDFMDKLYKQPFGTVIKINDYSANELNLLSNYLYEWFNEVILPKINDKMLIVYEIDGMKTIKHTVQKDLNRIIDMFKNNQYFDIDRSYTTINAYDETIYLNMFDRIYFKDISGNVERPENRRSVHGDGFFPRKLNGNYKLLEPYLECCQIYGNYTIDGKVKSSVNVPCFIYALEQAGVDKNKLQKILAFVGFQKRINRTQWSDIANAFDLRIHLVKDISIMLIKIIRDGTAKQDRKYTSLSILITCSLIKNCQ